MRGKTDWRGSKVHQNTELWTELMVNQWNWSGIFSRFITLQLSQNVKNLLYRLGETPENLIHYLCMQRGVVIHRFWEKVVLHHRKRTVRVRISHGSNKFVTDSNNNDTESPKDLPEEQTSQLKVFADRSKAKTKPQKREPVDYSPSIIPMSERKWIDIEPRKSSLSANEIWKKVIHLLRHWQQVHREDDGTVHFWRIEELSS